MNTLELTESQVILLLEQGKVDAGSCLVVNIDWREGDYVPW